MVTVPAAVAAHGWAVQVYDDTLKNKIGEVQAGTATRFDQITTSDPAPAGYYLVVSEHGGSTGCKGLAGAWPVGFLRAGEGTPAAGRLRRHRRRPRPPRRPAAELSPPGRWRPRGAPRPPCG